MTMVIDQKIYYYNKAKHSINVDKFWIFSNYIASSNVIAMVYEKWEIWYMYPSRPREIYRLFLEMPIVAIENSNNYSFEFSYTYYLWFKCVLLHGDDYQVADILLPDTDNPTGSYGTNPECWIYERILKWDQVGGDNIKTIFSLQMKKESEKKSDYVAVHCSSGFYLFEMGSNQLPIYLNVQKKKLEAFPVVCGFGYFEAEEGKIFVFD